MYNVLIVDDSAIVRSVVKKTLKLSNIEFNEIHEAANGRDGLVELEKNWIDIIFADINMPVMNGLEMVAAMKQQGILESTPVVIISTERSETRIQELRAMGVRGYINKPFSPEMVNNIMKEVLDAGQPA
jgi:two-component system chemotaxis response regulator CheY